MTTPTNEARVQELIEAIRCMPSQIHAREAYTEAFNRVKLLVRSLAASATQVPEHWKVVNEAQRAYGGIVKAAINLIAEVDERHDTKDVPLKHTVPYAAVVALRAAIEGFPPAPQAATQGEAVVWQGGLSNEELRAAWNRKLPGVKPTDFDLSAFALGIEVGREPAPAPSKEQTNG